MRRLSAALLSVFLGMAGVAAQGSEAVPTADQQAVIHLMRATWERPDAPLDVAPVVVLADRAVASWVQGDMGGRALLKKQRGKWEVVLCSGDALREEAFLRKFGMKQAEAAAMVKSVVNAEAALPRERVALFSRFDGVVLMEAGGGHPPAHGGHAGHPSGKH